jgi:hypothetical protein
MTRWDARSTVRPRDKRLYAGTAVVRGQTGEVTAGVEIRLAWMPWPSVEFVLQGGADLIRTTMAPDDRVQPWFEIDLGPKGEVAGQAFQWWFPRGGVNATTGARVHGRIRPSALGRGSGLARVEFGLANLDGLDTNGILEAGGWHLRLEKVDSGLRGAGYLITHRATLSRSDAGSFAADDAAVVLECLVHCLAFASGGWVGVVAPVGRSVSGRATWQKWDVTRTDDLSLHRSWLPWNEGGAAALATLWSGFWRRWSTPDGEATIRTMMPIFVEAGHMKTPEAGLVLDQLGLELLSWIVVVEELKTVSGDGHDKLTAADRVRLLLAPRGVDLTVPSVLGQLVASCPNRDGWMDGPHAINSVRDSAVHPRSRRSRPVSDAAVREAGALAESYWLRGLLGYFDYQGEYQSRVTEDISHTP